MRRDSGGTRDLEIQEAVKRIRSGDENAWGAIVKFQAFADQRVTGLLAQHLPPARQEWAGELLAQAVDVVTCREGIRMVVRGRFQELSGPVADRLRDLELTTREMAAQALAELGAAVELPRLKASLADPAPAVRIAVIDAVRRLGGWQPGDLDATVREDPNMEVREAAKLALETLKRR